jgi:hypothetical protein
MRSRLGISISVGTLELIECGPAEEEGQSPHDHIPLYFIAAPSKAARRPSERFCQGRGLTRRDGAHQPDAVASALSFPIPPIHGIGVQIASRPYSTSAVLRA